MKSLKHFTTQELIEELEIRENYHLAREIRELRMGRGLTLEEFGKLFRPPANKGTVSGWEKGKCSPNRKRTKVLRELKGGENEWEK